MSRTTKTKLQFPNLVSITFLMAILSLFNEFRSLADDEQKPVLLYSRYYNAEGETRYLPDGTYRDVLAALGEEFDVRVHADRPTRKVLQDVDLILISNPSHRAVNDHPEPAHLDEADQRVLLKFVKQGGGVILMGNQENHNLETENVNRFLSHFGMQWADVYTDAKGLLIPAETPVVGGLKWGYYTGNQIQLTNARNLRRWAVLNDLNQAPENGKRDAVGVLLAGAQYGKGRLVAVTDSGWIINSVLAGRGLGGVVIPEDDNLELMRRLCRWASNQQIK